MAATPIDVPLASRSPGERRIYTWGAIAALVVAFAGFAPTYYLKGVFAGPELNPLKHVHGVVMTAWLALFLVQARLVATHRVALHRQLGIAGALLALLVVVVGVSAGVASARAGFAPPGVPPLVFLVLPLGEMVTFAVLVSWALASRRKRDWHKRLMLIATLAMLTPAMARIAGNMMGVVVPPLFFAMTDVLIVAAALYDWRANQRWHPAYTWGLAIVVVSQFGRLALTRTDAWMSFARWVAGA